MPVLHRKNRDEFVEFADEKPSSVHKYPHGVSTRTRGALVHTQVEVATLSTAVHMSYPHVLQRFMNNFGIAFRTWRSYAVGPPCASSPVRRRQNRSMRPRAPHCSATWSRAPIGTASGPGRPTPTTPGARPAKAPRIG